MGVEGVVFITHCRGVFWGGEEGLVLALCSWLQGSDVGLRQALFTLAS